MILHREERKARRELNQVSTFDPRPLDQRMKEEKKSPGDFEAWLIKSMPSGLEVVLPIGILLHINLVLQSVLLASCEEWPLE